MRRGPFSALVSTLLTNENIKKNITDHQPDHIKVLINKINTLGDDCLSSSELEIFLNRLSHIMEALEDEMDKRGIVY
jgi:hypothetical protein